MPLPKGDIPGDPRLEDLPEEDTPTRRTTPPAGASAAPSPADPSGADAAPAPSRPLPDPAPAGAMKSRSGRTDGPAQMRLDLGEAGPPLPTDEGVGDASFQDGAPPLAKRSRRKDQPGDAFLLSLTPEARGFLAGREPVGSRNSPIDDPFEDAAAPSSRHEPDADEPRSEGDLPASSRGGPSARVSPADMSEDPPARTGLSATRGMVPPAVPGTPPLVASPDDRLSGRPPAPLPGKGPRGARDGAAENAEPDNDAGDAEALGREDLLKQIEKSFSGVGVMNLPQRDRTDDLSPPAHEMMRAVGTVTRASKDDMDPNKPIPDPRMPHQIPPSEKSGKPDDKDIPVAAWIDPDIVWPEFMRLPPRRIREALSHPDVSDDIREMCNRLLHDKSRKMLAHAEAMDTYITKYGDPVLSSAALASRDNYRNAFRGLFSILGRRLPAMEEVPLDIRMDPFKGIRFALLLNPDAEALRRDCPVATWGHNEAVTFDNAKVTATMDGMKAWPPTQDAAVTMVREAWQRGWDTITIDGTPEFCRAAVAEVRKLGMGAIVHERVGVAFWKKPIRIMPPDPLTPKELADDPEKVLGWHFLRNVPDQSPRKGAGHNLPDKDPLRDGPDSGAGAAPSGDAGPPAPEGVQEPPTGQQMDLARKLAGLAGVDLPEDVPANRNAWRMFVTSGLDSIGDDVDQDESRRPTERQIAFARHLAERSGVDCPDDALESRESWKEFVGNELRRIDGDGKGPDPSPENVLEHDDSPTP